MTESPNDKSDVKHPSNKSNNFHGHSPFLSGLNRKAVEAAAVTAIHALAEATMISVAVVMGVVSGVGVACGLLVSAGHGINSSL